MAFSFLSIKKPLNLLGICKATALPKEDGEFHELASNKKQALPHPEFSLGAKRQIVFYRGSSRTSPVTMHGISSIIELL
ncbi:hypothetical protein [Paenibacillus massiliensis]|nr:hypothetical protein [Paenibacillus massiliensis]